MNVRPSRALVAALALAALTGCSRKDPGKTQGATATGTDPDAVAVVAAWLDAISVGNAAAAIRSVQTPFEARGFTVPAEPDFSACITTVDGEIGPGAVAQDAPALDRTLRCLAADPFLQRTYSRDALRTDAVELPPEDGSPHCTLARNEPGKLHDALARYRRMLAGADPASQLVELRGTDGGSLDSFGAFVLVRRDGHWTITHALFAESFAD